MRLERFGIVLRSMETRDLEMVRNWRNAPHVRANMEFQDTISSEMQKKWFAGLDPNRDLYLIAEQQATAFAVLHVKGIDWGDGSGEAGIFVGEQSYLGSFLPVLAVLAMMDLIFFGWGLKRLFAKVRADRAQVMDFNRRLGYAPLPDQAGQNFIRLVTDPEAYLFAAKVLRRQAQKYQKGKVRLQINEADFPGKWKATAAQLEAEFSKAIS